MCMLPMLRRARRARELQAEALAAACGALAMLLRAAPAWQSLPMMSFFMCTPARELNLLAKPGAPHASLQVRSCCLRLHSRRDVTKLRLKGGSFRIMCCQKNPAARLLATAVATAASPCVCCCTTPAHQKRFVAGWWLVSSHQVLATNC